MTDDGIVVGAIAAVNAAGSVTIGSGPHFWAGAFEDGQEFGGLGWPSRFRRRAQGPDQAAPRNPPPLPWSQQTRS